MGGHPPCWRPIFWWQERGSTRTPSALVVRCVCGVCDAATAVMERPDQRPVSIAAPVGFTPSLDISPPASRWQRVGCHPPEAALAGR
ncbi:MAG: hypothetical protein ACRDZ7_15870 [Acidimicrobiia bacterium]